jgi:hypothetical protein
MKRRRTHHLVTPSDAPSDQPSILTTESDAGDRVRDWDLPVSTYKRKNNNVLAALGFLAIIAIAGITIWYFLRHLQPAIATPAVAAGSSETSLPKEVDTLPGGVTPNGSNTEPQPTLPRNSRVVARLVAPSNNEKWSLSEYPASGDRVELDPSGAYAFVKNFTETCVRAPPGQELGIGVRARESSVSVRTNVTTTEVCAMIFDEPLYEIKLPSGELRAVQFGLQQGTPFVAVKRIKTLTAAQQTIRELP